MTEKRIAVLVSSPAGVVLGMWTDVPRPRWRQGASAQALSLRLPRAYGALDEPGEEGGAGTLALGNYVTILSAGPDAQGEEIELSAVGSAAVGTAAVGASIGLGRTLFRGTIEDSTPTPPMGVEVSISPLGDRLLAQTPIAGTYSASGDPVTIAQQIVHDYLPALSWDARNPATCGAFVTVEFKNQMVEGALRQLRDLAGANWFVGVTARGTVRFFEPDLDGAATHYLLAGVHATDVKLHKSGINRLKQVIVTFAGGGSEEARALDWTASDPRATFITAEHLTAADDARRLAALKLAELDRITLRGECTVHEGVYDIDSFEVGDTVRLMVERPLGTSAVSAVGSAVVGLSPVGIGGYLDYAAQNLVIAGFDHDVYTVRLELTEPQPRQVDMISALARKVQNHVGRG